MSVRKIETMKDVKELNLDSKSFKVVAVHGYDVPMLVTAARCGELRKLDGIGKVSEERILAKIDEAGFILHESIMSQRIRQLLATAFFFPLGLTEEYEARVEFTEQQIDALFETFRNILTERETTILSLRFGLNGTEPMNLREVADEFTFSSERTRCLEAKALRKLRHPRHRRALQEIFPNWSGFDLAVPKRAGNYNGPIEEMPLEELACLSVKAYNCLLRAKIRTVGQLTQLTYDEVRKMRNMDKRGADNVVASLLGLDLKLKTESDS